MTKKLSKKELENLEETRDVWQEVLESIEEIRDGRGTQTEISPTPLQQERGGAEGAGVRDSHV